MSARLLGPTAPAVMDIMEAEGRTMGRPCELVDAVLMDDIIVVTYDCPHEDRPEAPARVAVWEAEGDRPCVGVHGMSRDARRVLAVLHHEAADAPGEPPAVRPLAWLLGLTELVRTGYVEERGTRLYLTPKVASACA